MTYEAVVFDLDGTLIDSLEDLATATNKVLHKYGFPEHGCESYRDFIGDGAAMLIERSLPQEFRNRKVISDCLSDFTGFYSGQMNKYARLYPGVAELLNGLNDRGIRMSVLSNKPHLLTGQCVEALLADWDFEYIFGQREGVPRKPDPSGAFEIAANSGISPEQFAYLGDSGVDMETAIGAGMYPVGALWGFRTEEELRQQGAKLVIGSPVELLKLFDE